MLAARLALFQMLYIFIFLYNCHKKMIDISINSAFNKEIVFSYSIVIIAIPFG